MRNTFSFRMRRRGEEFGERGCTLVRSTLPVWMDGISDRSSGREALGRRMESSRQTESRWGRFVRGRGGPIGPEPQFTLSGQFDSRAQVGVPPYPTATAPCNSAYNAVCVRQPFDYFVFSGGTLAPFFRASESPIAIACFLLTTIPPLPPFPERRVPRFLRRMAARTDLLAAFPYLAICPSHRIVPVAWSS
jgi:hypothetical protein